MDQFGIAPQSALIGVIRIGNGYLRRVDCTSLVNEEQNSLPCVPSMFDAYLSF